MSVRQAGDGGGGGPRRVRRVWEPSLPARLMVLSQSLRRAAHLCEALGVWARPHAAFLWLLDLCQDVPDLPLSQLGGDRGKDKKD